MTTFTTSERSEVRPQYYLWVLAAGLVAAATLFSHASLSAGTEFSAVFFTRRMMLGMLLAGTVMSVADLERWRFWAIVVGLFPACAVAVYMVLRGPGNIWPIALAMALTIGLVPAFAGAILGRVIRWLARMKPKK